MSFYEENFDEGEYINRIINRNFEKNISINMNGRVIVHLYEIPDEILLSVALGEDWSDDRYQFGSSDLLRACFKMEINRREKLKKSYNFEFKEEVIFAMVEAGISRRVAENMTADNSGLMEQAKKFKII